MNNLPTEILVDIFQYLHLKQKLECMLVCNTWANVLRDGYLFETIELSNASSYQSFNDEFVSLVKKAKDGSGRKCNRLVCINDGTIRIQGATLASSFPSLNFLRWKEHIINTKGDPFIHDVTESDPFQGWRNNLETFFGECYVENYMLEFLFTGIFHRLETLTVFCSDLYGSDLKSRDFYRRLLTKLDNMPALSTLTIRSDDLSILDLEELHKRAPGLVSLTLTEGFCTDLEDISKLEITPAENLKVFKLVEFYSDGPVLDTLLQYVKLKYTQLNEFYHYETHHRHNFSMSTPIFSNSIWTDFIPAVGPRLTKCTIALKHKAAEIFNLMEMYMGPVESLNVDVFRFKRMFKKVMSKPAFLNLRALTLRQLPYDFKMSDFKNLTKLHRLTLDLSRNSTMYDNGQLYSITLNSIAKDLPKGVETLTLTYANVIVDQEQVENESSLIVNLNIYDSHVIDQNTSNYLSQHFPKLKSLVFQKCKTVDSLELPQHHLSYFVLVPSDSVGVEEFTPESIRERELELRHMKVTTQGRTLYYKVPVFEAQYFNDPHPLIMDGNDHSIEKTIRASEYDEDLNYFHLKCASVETAYFFNYYLLA
ncbi:hypothetical protein K501DRAFT_312098 [Backusella circina FSU 941]|nr:hypothetical protein K501DRAFT_312098 [Backusella circina FSU 941]